LIPIRREPPSRKTQDLIAIDESKLSVKPLLHEFSDLMDPKGLPRRRKYLHYYIVGFVDGEGCFSVSIKKQEDTKFGWVIDPVFHITQDKERSVILEIIKRVFNCGRIIPKPGREDAVLQYVVDSRRHLAEVIIPFFDKHKPIVKQREFKAFKEIVQSLEKGEHRSPEGFIELLEKAYKMSCDRKHSLEEVVSKMKERVGASETIRREPLDCGEDMVQHHDWCCLR
jgi:hypothetical protein